MPAQHRSELGHSSPGADLEQGAVVWLHPPFRLSLTVGAFEDFF